jgi:hypothetical protein
MGIHSHVFYSKKKLVSQVKRKRKEQKVIAFEAESLLLKISLAEFKQREYFNK